MEGKKLQFISKIQIKFFSMPHKLEESQQPQIKDSFFLLLQYSQHNQLICQFQKINRASSTVTYSISFPEKYIRKGWRFQN